MDDLFPGFYPFTRKQLKDLSKNATIVLGASVLLDLYRISYWRVFLDIIEKDSLKDRLWIPYDTAWLYHHRLPEVIKSELEEVRTAGKYLEQFKSKIDNPFGHPFIARELIEQYNQFLDSATSSLEQDAKYLSDGLRNSELKNRISSIFKDKIGAPYEDYQMTQLYDESKKCFMSHKPPCISVSNSIDNRIKANRFIIWKQIQQQAKDSKKPILLVLNRITPNWFDIYNEDTILPQHELINEFKSVTEVDLHITTAYDFIKHFGRNHPGKNDLLKQLHHKPTLGNLQHIQIPVSSNQTDTAHG